MPRRLRFVIPLLLVAIAGCSDSGRPSVEAWLPEWRATVAAVNEATSAGVTPAREVCQEVLVVLREANTSLANTPSAALDAPVDGWLNTAESAFFECEEATVDNDPFGDALRSLDEFEAEVEAALDIEAQTE